MKIKGKVRCILLVIILVVLIGCVSYASSDDVTQKLYQDITINSDGSITIKEAALLSGEYNGRSREIKYKSNNSVTFSGIYSNFAGNTDIYDGTNIKNIKIYDISQNNFNTIDDIGNEEKEYEEVKSASNGKYGVYTMYRSGTGAEFKIFCPNRKRKVFCMEYTIEDAVVVHNDIAELYWNLMGNNYREEIEDFQAKVHLPGEDNDLRVWTHGPLTGVNKILDNKTVMFSDENVKPYRAETIRLMFNKDLVPNASKKSNVNGRENILKYENMMANDANAEREKEKLNKINEASQSVKELEETPTMYKYNYALKEVNSLEDSKEKEEFLTRIENVKDVVNITWKEYIEHKLDHLSSGYMLTRSYVESLSEDISEGFDEEAKAKYKKELIKYEEILDARDARTRVISKSIVIITYVILLIAIIYELIKIVRERNICKDIYYRDFPDDYNPYIIEYLMKKRITNLSISTTILNLINKKVIKLEENPKDKKDAILILENENANLNNAENEIISMLFSLVGNNNRCTLEELKNYGKTESKAISLQNKIKRFKKEAKIEAKTEEFFEKPILNIILKIVVIINYVFSLFMAVGVFKGLTDNGGAVLIYLLGVSLVTTIFYMIVNKDKSRTEKGKEKYSKWLAHKRFLKAFGNFDEKDLPDITLWDKYLVTATILGCADKVQKKMKLYINNNNSDVTAIDYILLDNLISNNMARSINNAVRYSINNASATISSSSSGGGFGGGSSFGGGGGRRWRRRRSFLITNNKNHI